MDRRFYPTSAYEKRRSVPVFSAPSSRANSRRRCGGNLRPGTAGAPGIHRHEHHEQFGLVVSGVIETHIGSDVCELGAGEMYHIPKGVDHGGTIVVGDEIAVVVDFFTPPREEYVRAAHGGPAFDPVTGR